MRDFLLNEKSLLAHIVLDDDDDDHDDNDNGQNSGESSIVESDLPLIFAASLVEHVFLTIDCKNTIFHDTLPVQNN